MNKQDFIEMAEIITRELSGKTIIKAAAATDDYGMGYSIALYFTDGTEVMIRPEHDEEFILEVVG